MRCALSSARRDSMVDRRLFLGVALLALPKAIRADEALTLSIGSRIRVTSIAPEIRSVVGRVVILEPDVVVVRDDDAGAESRVPVTPSTTFEVSAGRKSHAGRGAVLGTAVGALPGLLMTFGDYNTDKGNPTATSIVGAATGAAIGSLIGWAVRSEDWRPGNTPSVTAAVAPVPRGASIAIRASW